MVENKKIAIININDKLKGIIKEIKKLTDYDITIIVSSKEIWNKYGKWHPDNLDDINLIFANPKEYEVLSFIKGFESVVVLRDVDIACDAETALITIAIEEADKDIHTVAEIYSSINKDHIETLNIDEIVCVGEVSEKMIAQGAITSKIDKLFKFLLDADGETAIIFIKKLPKEYFIKNIKYIDILKLFLEKNIKIIPIGYINEITKNNNRVIREYKINPKSNEDRHKILNENTEIIFIGMKGNMELL